MSYLSLTHIVCRIGIVVSLPLIALVPCIAEEETGILSGVVLDMEGKPIPGFTVVLASILFMKSETDENGVFTFTNVPAERIQILIPSQRTPFGPDNEIVSIKIGGITFYEDRYPTKFGIKPGSHTKNVIVTVRPRERVRVRVVFKDGKPLTNGAIVRTVKTRGSSTGPGTTDSDGYFIYYIDKYDVLSTCKISIKHNELSAELEPFEIEKGGRYDDLVLTLNGASPPDKSASTETKRSASSKRVPLPRKRGSWVVNPENGHAYKKIWCRDLNDAKSSAAAEDAYLVVINDAAEQKWLSGIFDNYLYWIGLSDAEKEGQWVWENGEPLTYTNWGDKRSVPRSSLSPKEKNRAVMTYVSGKWYAVGPGDFFWSETQYAILEKADVLNNSSIEKK